MTSFVERWRGRAASLAIFGDSITAGSAASTPERRWANRLGAALGVRLANKGIGATILQNSADASGRPRPDNGFSRYRRDLLGSDRADLVAILYGFNDARYTLAPATLNADGFRRDYLRSVAAACGRRFVAAPDTSFAAVREAKLDRLADLVAERLDRATVDVLLGGRLESAPALRLARKGKE